MQPYTFWQLANQYKIEIPIIQRDYAQGRNDKKSEEIRDKFLNDLLNHLQNETPIELDFVYGKVSNGVFIPIDGQQRLTTLFLLHWYIATKTGNKELLKKISFTYKTRVSARDFCAELVQKHDILIDENITPSKTIEDTSWFYLSWKKDPTIQSMLRMLDSIHQEFKDKKLENFWLSLISEHYTLSTNNLKLNELVQVIEENGNQETQSKLNETQQRPVISFKFLNLDEFELSDDLYLKMNARGRALSDFENFKASFIGYIDGKGFETNDDWIKDKLDKKEWTDLFWKNKNENNSIDNLFIKFIANHIIIQYAQTVNIYDNELEIESIQKELSEETGSNVTDEAVKKERIERRIRTLFNKPNELKPYDFIDEDGFSGLLKSLNWHSENADFEQAVDLWDLVKKKTLFKEIIKEEETTYKQRVLFYAQTFYFQSNDIPNKHFNDWIRVVRNIVENATIDTATAFIGAISLIKELSQGVDDISKFLSENDIKSDFASSQVEEEKLKAFLISNNPDWKQSIIEAENHPMFRGNIGFLLSNGENSDLETFIKWKEVTKKLFDKEDVTVEKENNLLGRTMLSIGLNLNDESLWLGGKTKQYWKDHLKDNHYIPHILKIIDELKDLDKGGFKAKLEDIIKCHKNDYASTSWKKNLIENPDLFSRYTCYGKISKTWRGINLYEQEKFNEKVNAILIENNRNEIIAKFLELGFELKNGSPRIDIPFFAGDRIELSKMANNSEKIELVFVGNEFEYQGIKYPLNCEVEILQIFNTENIDEEKLKRLEDKIRN